MEKMIEVKGLKKNYGSVQAVREIDFDVQKGSMFAFLGPNGAGKSTVIDILCTFQQPDRGRVKIAGLDRMREAAEIRENIGVVFQEQLLDQKLTVRENLMIRAGFYYKRTGQKKEAIEKAARYAEITEFMDRPYGKLSGGQKRRADIARALLNTPKILFLDEPTTGLDPQTREHIWETIEKLQKEKEMTIFLTTHYMEEAAKADYVVIMDHGEIVAQGTPYDLKEAYSYDHIRLICKRNVSDGSEIKQYLNQQNLEWTEKGENFDVRIVGTLQAIRILSSLEPYIESFEVLHGTMDDVFLNITGKEIRG
ncbi:MAG: ATP-binding cassette domain-containing protein [Lachnospiraceae bacterium]|nr:ATP-binding cassette domain-containing protein [Robinsoniella sp.]MDY3767847.1 ATP-binding cassette domain-containing protein [Lachnospiraceae bacterium]